MAGERVRVLLIEDDPDMQLAVRAMLPEGEFDLTCCSTGPAGLEAMRQAPPDVVLLDIMLSSPSEGFHLCYEIRQDARLRDVPVIMISAIGKAMGMDYARELGTEYMPAEAFLEKPLEAASLLDAVRRLSRRREAPA